MTPFKALEVQVRSMDRARGPPTSTEGAVKCMTCWSINFRLRITKTLRKYTRHKHPSSPLRDMLFRLRQPIAGVVRPRGVVLNSDKPASIVSDADLQCGARYIQSGIRRCRGPSQHIRELHCSSGTGFEPVSRSQSQRRTRSTNSIISSSIVSRHKDQYAHFQILPPGCTL